MEEDKEELVLVTIKSRLGQETANPNIVDFPFVRNPKPNRLIINNYYIQNTYIERPKTT